ncbi:MAG: hypothetical protein EZS28_042537 [Streblomastix strix]|uniref:Uncharacterized protein n=1 Tax=Streblomastix strix TaxID=222440 RepID=A0A5J4TTT2_9EUKA|nr:MAG: hypothetical protein EZS28_042537 [Streblomastix strix]
MQVVEKEYYQQEEEQGISESDSDKGKEQKLDDQKIKNGKIKDLQNKNRTHFGQQDQVTFQDSQQGQRFSPNTTQDSLGNSALQKDYEDDETKPSYCNVEKDDYT